MPWLIAILWWFPVVDRSLFYFFLLVQQDSTYLANLCVLLVEICIVEILSEAELNVAQV